MYLKIIFNLFLIVLLAVFQIGFISGLPGWPHYINLGLIALVFLLVIYNYRLANGWALGVGLLLDFFSFNYFGINMFSFFITALIADIVLTKLLTNRSLYSIMALMTVAYVTFQALVISSSYLINFLSRQDNGYLFTGKIFITEIAGLGVNLILTAFVFYIMVFFSHRLKPSILKPKI